MKFVLSIEIVLITAIKIVFEEYIIPQSSV